MINEGSLLQTFESQTINVQFDKLNVHFLFSAKLALYLITNIVQAFSTSLMKHWGILLTRFC